MELNLDLLDKITQKIGDHTFKFKEPMSKHTSMEVGGPAQYYFTPDTKEDIIYLVEELKAAGFPFYIKGNGSNIIVKDSGYEGAIIETKNIIDVRITQNRVTAGAGVLLKDLSEMIAEAGLEGFEFASGIPGSLGGAVCMNAGAYDGEMKDIIESVTLIKLTGEKPEVVTLKNEEMDFSYRHSICSSAEYVVLEATMNLNKGIRSEIRARIDGLTVRRAEKQPLEYPSCGSTFKRPEGYFAGKLITEAGMKGYCLGGAQVSEKHAGFIINRDKATATEILALIKLVQQKVFETSGVKLECEVKILG